MNRNFNVDNTSTPLSVTISEGFSMTGGEELRLTIILRFFE
jgi:hypothetical protein